MANKQSQRIVIWRAGPSLLNCVIRRGPMSTFDPKSPQPRRLTLTAEYLTIA